ncbi:MAG: hypothetical protein AAFX56_09115 [Pseudomonadota bacterium]
MTKTRAALLHLLVSASAVGAVLAVVFFVWYPGFLFPLAGAIDPVLIMIGVDVTLGPLLTFVVYKQGKPGLKFDLGFIFTVQLIALVYGSWTLYQERPQFLVFAKDSFTAIAARQIDRSALRYDELREPPANGARLVFARTPTDPEEYRAFVEGVLFEGERDLERRAEYFEPYANGAGEIRAQAIRIGEFSPATAEERDAILQARARFEDEHPALGLIPARSFTEDYALLLDLETLLPLDAVRVKAWGRADAADDTATNTGAAEASISPPANKPDSVE